MYLLYRHLLKAAAGPFLFGFLVITFTLIIEVLYRYIELFVSKGVPFGQATEVLALSLGHTFALSIPMAVLIGVLMGVGQLAADHEVVAMKASGIGLVSLLRPLLAGAFVVTLALVAYNHFVFPESNHRLANLLYDINRKRPMLEIREQMFTELTEKVTIYVQEKDDRTGRIKGVQILEKAHPTDLRPQLTTAAWGQVVPKPADDALLLELHDGEIHSLPDDNDPAKYSVARFAVHNLYVRNAERDFENSNRTSRGDREMNLTALGAAAAREREDQRKVLADAAVIGAKVARRQWRLLDPAQRSELLGREPGGVAAAGFREATLRATQQEVELAASSARVQVQILESHHILENKYRVEFHKKLAIPVACLIFVLLGLPLAVTTARSGRGVSVTLAMALYLVYYLFLIGGEKLADRGRLNPILAMWTANIVLAVVSVPVLIAAVRESGPFWRRRRAPAPAAPPSPTPQLPPRPAPDAPPDAPPAPAGGKP